MSILHDAFVRQLLDRDESDPEFATLLTASLFLSGSDDRIAGLARSKEISQDSPLNEALIRHR